MIIGEHGETLERYFAAMRRGAEAEEEMLSLFSEDAVYIEPFSGEEHAAVGHEEIAARLRTGWEAPLPDMELDVLRIEAHGSSASSSWECRSSAFPAPVRGTDTYSFDESGLIQRLEVRIDLAE